MSSITVSGYNANGHYKKGNVPLNLCAGLVVQELGSPSPLSASVIATNLQPGDRIAFTNPVAGQGNQYIAPGLSSDEKAYVLVVYSTTNASTLTQLLSTLTFQCVAGSPNTTATRVITLIVNNQLNNSTSVSQKVTVSL